MRRWLRVLLTLLGAVVLIAYLIAFALEEPLRRYMERRFNAAATGYTLRIGELDLHPLALSADLREVRLVQDATRRPVVSIPELAASIHWRALLYGRIVGNVALRRPQIRVDLRQLRSEARDAVPIAERGWQEAVRSVYPLEINLLTVEEGAVTYVDEGPFEPLRLSGLNLTAENIRNVRSPERVYPSRLQAEAVVFGAGRLELIGNADFLAEPHPGAAIELTLAQVDLSYFKPITDRLNLAVERGVLSLHGTAEYAPGKTLLNLEELTVRGARIDYVHREVDGAEERIEGVGEAAAQTHEDPTTWLRIARLDILDSNLGFVNRGAEPDYRVYIGELQLRLRNYSNRFSAGPATFSLNGNFMGSGAARARGVFRPERRGPDFELDVAVEGTELTQMNDLFRAYGNFDVAGGSFSFYSELTVKDRSIDGYVKPLFTDMEVYDRRQDEEKDLFSQLYEALAEGVAELLENPRERVATEAEIEGRVSEPRISTWQVIVRLIQNAFYRSILPGFEGEID